MLDPEREHSGSAKAKICGSGYTALTHLKLLWNLSQPSNAELEIYLKKTFVYVAHFYDSW